MAQLKSWVFFYAFIIFFVTWIVHKLVDHTYYLPHSNPLYAHSSSTVIHYTPPVRQNFEEVIPLEKKQTFWADEPINAKLSEIPRSEKSTVIRMALRQWFGITGSKEPITTDDARLVARELVRNLKEGKEKEL